MPFNTSNVRLLLTLLSKSYQHFIINYVDNFINFVIDIIEFTITFTKPNTY